MSFKRTAQLHTGARIPLLGLGTWQAEPDVVGNAVKIALEAGYRHIDCAYIYQNEAEIGAYLKKTTIPREEIFITSKLWNTEHHPDRVEAALDKTLKDLQLEYLDLYLIHWPFPQPAGNDHSRNSDGTPKEDTERTYSIKDTWEAMEKMVKKGKAKHIGLSNFNQKRITEILSFATVRPAVLQVELHPFLPQNDLIEFCKKENIHVTAYSPLGSNFEPKVLENQKLESIAKKYNTDVAKVVLAWGQQRGTSVIPKSVNEKRIVGNFQDIEISDEDIKNISSLGINRRFNDFFPVFDN